MLDNLCITLMPEPRMARSGRVHASLRRAIATPLVDANYRRLVGALFLWNLAQYLGTPFFAVLMLKQLGLPLSLVTGLFLPGQVAGIFTLGIWGPLIDRLGSRTALSAAAGLYLAAFVGWLFVATAGRHLLTLPLLVLLHVIAGTASAGVNIASTTTRMKLAPRAEAASYLAMAGLVSSMGSGLGALLGGVLHRASMAGRWGHCMG